MKKKLLKLFVIVLSILLSACSKTINWQEEVLLTSGQKIIVDRSVKLISAELGQRRPSIYEISAENPANGKEIDWEGAHGLNPILLDFKNNKVFLVALPGSCDAKIKHLALKAYHIYSWKVTMVRNGKRLTLSNSHLNSRMQT